MIADLALLWLAEALIFTMGWCFASPRHALILGFVWPLYPVLAIVVLARRLRVPSRP